MYLLKTRMKYLFFFGKPVTVFKTLTLVFTYLIIYNYLRRMSTKQPAFIHFGNVTKHISCHYLDENDALPSAEDRNFLPEPNSIFFHETSCRGGLNSRQACAVEAAARAHPERQVYVMFSGPVSEVVYQRSSIAKLRRFVNVKLARLHIANYTRNTPLEDMLERLKKSKWPVEHTADVLRYLTLYKWGGLYLDLDMLVVKSLTPLGHNWVARESKTTANNASLAFSMDHIGRKIVESLINEVNMTYRPDIWAHNGPGAVTRVLRKMCNTSRLTEWSPTTCQGVEVYGPEYLYPRHYSKNGEYYKPGELKNVERAYAHHFWSKLSYDKKIEKDSPYEKMAKKYCPTIYEMYGEEFGS